MWVNWTSMKLIAVRSQYIWNVHSSLLNACNCMQIDSSNRKGELKSFERGLEVLNFYLIPESTIYLFFLPLDLDEMNLKPQPKKTPNYFEIIGILNGNLSNGKLVIYFGQNLGWLNMSILHRLLFNSSTCRTVSSGEVARWSGSKDLLLPAGAGSL